MKKTRCNSFEIKILVIIFYIKKNKKRFTIVIENVKYTFYKIFNLGYSIKEIFIGVFIKLVIISLLEKKNRSNINFQTSALHFNSISSVKWRIESHSDVQSLVKVFVYF